jgi:YfiH family protein
VIELDLPGARVVFTGRAEGDVREDGPRERLERLAGRPLARGRQVHGAHVHRAMEPRVPAGKGDPGVIGSADSAEEADGQATARQDLAPAVLVADCLPVAIAGEGAVAMVHAGWRGLAAEVIEHGVDAVRELGATGPLTAAIGPGAGPCCYEVGDEVRAAFGLASAGSRTIDLKALARERLAASGVDEIHDTAVCTICDERFFSYRREGAAAGRQAGVAWLR